MSDEEIKEIERLMKKYNLSFIVVYKCIETWGQIFEGLIDELVNGKGNDVSVGLVNAIEEEVFDSADCIPSPCCFISCKGFTSRAKCCIKL